MNKEVTASLATIITAKQTGEANEHDFEPPILLDKLEDTFPSSLTRKSLHGFTLPLG